MRSIFIGFLFALACYGNAYSMDWSGNYDNSSMKMFPLDSTFQISRTGNNSYKFNLSVTQRGVPYPATCILKNGNGKEIDGQLYIYNPGGKHIYTLNKDSDLYNLKAEPDIKGLFSNCFFINGKKLNPDDNANLEFGQTLINTKFKKSK